MISAILKPSAALILLLCVFTLLAKVGRNALTNEIVSNTMYQICGSGDTVWILSSKGANFTTALNATTPQWRGLTGLPENNYSCTFGNGAAFLCIGTESAPNYCLYFNHATNAATSITLPHQVFAFKDSAATLLALDACVFQNSFWVACYDGGLMQVSSAGTVVALLCPGDSTMYNTPVLMAQFTPANLPLIAKPHSRAVSVAADSNRLWVVCEKALWSLTIQGLKASWTKIADSAISVINYREGMVQTAATHDTTKVFALLRTKNGLLGDTLNSYLYAYNAATQRWNKVLERPCDNFKIGGKRLYCIDYQNNLSCYRDTTPPIGIDPNTAYLEKAAIPSDRFTLRIKKSDADVESYTIYDINYTTTQTKASLQIATDEGLYYSTNEDSCEALDLAFKREYRTVALAANLKKTYAYPSIINGSTRKKSEAIFAYNLEKDDYVTIDVYDFNMDHVVRIIDKALRKAGVSNTSGRSTNPLEDRWNATVDNRTGRTVMPGVYYYKISTQSGSRAFGKIIVAKN
ncbi:MAG: hypothetical protein JW795_01865 [Chitinivibrionales bacterium]|nr:hypothetical protein [Chitinivibrionales bacterium]